MTNKIYSAILEALGGILVEIETGLMNGLNFFSIIGLPDKAIQEAKERINLALKSINAKPPLKFNKRIVVNLAPANLKKEGSYLDLGITISFLRATNQIKFPNKKILFLGELGLDGSLKKIKGLLPIILNFYKEFDEIYIPYENLNEVKYLQIKNLYLFKNLKEIIDHLENINPQPHFEPLSFFELYQKNESEFDFIKISDFTLRGIIIAAAGRHNLLLFGPPGTGKTLIAKNLVNLLPNLNYEESLEVSSIYSAYGYHLDHLIINPPFRNPHHSSSAIAIIGGGQNPKPGEITLAHRGVLFLDELPEFKRDVLESLREPLDSGEINISRARKNIKFPSRFLFIGAYNPCPCGFYNDPEKECRCYLNEILKYYKKISGPLLDRIDMQLNIPRLKSEAIFSEEKNSFKKIKKKIEEMKIKQFERQNKFNSELSLKEIKIYCRLDKAAEDFLRNSIDKFHLSLRAINKIIKIGKTIADLENKEIIQIDHIAEALQYRINNLEND
ncbi:MAG: YifB family Mg chelatase-like AAA ATPase [Patescibacteria group bacterium]|nr:YifB family Mg chelatase-like AAA ATPase [Patescibacteria group bacterium]